MQCRPIQPSNGKSGSFFTLYNVVQQNAELETYRCLQALISIQNISPKFRSFLNLPAVAFKFWIHHKGETPQKSSHRKFHILERIFKISEENFQTQIYINIVERKLVIQIVNHNLVHGIRHKIQHREAQFLNSHPPQRTTSKGEEANVCQTYKRRDWRAWRGVSDRVARAHKEAWWR